MCMCGELDPSYVCMAHRGTREDYRFWLDDGPESPQEEAERRRNEYVELVVEPALRRAA